MRDDDDDDDEGGGGGGGHYDGVCYMNYTACVDRLVRINIQCFEVR